MSARSFSTQASEVLSRSRCLVSNSSTAMVHGTHREASGGQFAEPERPVTAERARCGAPRKTNWWRRLRRSA